MIKPSRPSKKADVHANVDSNRRSDRGDEEKRAARGEQDKSDDRLLMVELSRQGLAAGDIAGSTSARRPEPTLPGFAEADAALLEPLRTLPAPVTVREAPRAFAPLVHNVDPRTTKV